MYKIYRMVPDLVRENPFADSLDLDTARRMLRIQEQIINWQNIILSTGLLAGRGGGYRLKECHGMYHIILSGKYHI